MLARFGRKAEKPRQSERKQVAALGENQRMQFVEDHAFERAEQIGRIGGRQQQRQLLRRRQQDLGRIAPLPLALGDWRVAGACFDADRQTHLGDGRFEVARDIDGERLQRRDVERVQPALAPQVAAGGEEFLSRFRRAGSATLLSSTRLGKKPASVLPPPVGAISNTERPVWPSPINRVDARAAPSRGW